MLRLDKNHIHKTKQGTSTRTLLFYSLETKPLRTSLWKPPTQTYLAFWILQE